jgi:hypothetical protein
MSTAILPQTLELGLSQANPGFLADALRKIDLGSFFKLQKETITQSSANTVVLSKAAFGPAMVQVRVTAGAGSALGSYLVADAAGAVVAVGTEVGVCKLSDDGLTLTFASGSNITGCVVSYLAAPAVPLDEQFGF